MAEKVGYPIGQQDFKTLREDNCLYVDKTKFIEKIVSPPNRYYSLARPRRFGKSLFLSSLQYFFEGRKELFRGLYIDSNDREWEKYPVFRLDLNTEKYEVPGLLDSLFDNIFKKWEKEYGIKEIAETLSTRFQNIIEAAHEKTGHQVVILVNSLAEKRRISYEEACHLLKNHYYGYRFAEEGSDIYNPWSVLNAMQDRTISNYWGRSGKATIIAETLKNVDADIEGILSSIVPMRTLEGLDLKSANPIALLYQTGYLTIKDYDFESDYVTLGVPNLEVCQSLFDDLLPYYVKTRRGTADLVVQNIIQDLRTGTPEKFVKDLDVFLAGIPYEMKMDDENNLHNALFILLTLIGVTVETEVHTSDGRIDLVVKTQKFIYIIELKFDQSAEEAMSQIEEKKYYLPYANDQRRLFKIGLNFSSKTRHLDPPRIEEALK